MVIFVASANPILEWDVKLLELSANREKYDLLELKFVFFRQIVVFCVSFFINNLTFSICNLTACIL